MASTVSKLQESRAQQLARVERELQSLDQDIRKAREEDGEILARLKRGHSPGGAWAALTRRRATVGLEIGLFSTQATELFRKAFIKESEEECFPKDIGEKQHYRQMRSTINSFEKFSDLDSESKRDRIRQVITAQEGKIRSILGRMKQRDALSCAESEAQDGAVSV